MGRMSRLGNALYEGDVSIRLNSGDYGDVLLIPNTVDADQLSTFFEPLGSVDELGEEYRFIHDKAYEGQVYGLATFGTAMGYVLNKPVWEKAGITETFSPGGRSPKSSGSKQ